MDAIDQTMNNMTLTETNISGHIECNDMVSHMFWTEIHVVGKGSWKKREVGKFEVGKFEVRKLPFKLESTNRC